MKKIVFFSGGIDRSGGTERVLSLVASGLSERDFEIIIVSMCGEKKSHYPLNEKIRVIYLEAPGFAKGILSNIKKLSDIVSLEKPDYWIDVDIILGLYTLFIRKKHKEMKWISWEHFNYYTKFPYYMTLRKITRKMVCRKSDALVVLSKEDEGYYKSNERIKGKLISISNPSPYEIIDIKYPKEKTVLAAGRLVEIKGFDLLLETWTQIEKDYPDWKLVIAGEGKERGKLEDIIKHNELKNVFLPGFVKDITELYQKSSVFVLSSRNEGFVMVLLEAMSFGLPCVGFGCKAGVREMIYEGENGFIAEPENCSELADKLRRIMNDEKLRQEMGKESQRIVKSFSIDAIITKWEGFLNSFDGSLHEI